MGQPIFEHQLRLCAFFLDIIDSFLAMLIGLPQTETFTIYACKLFVNARRVLARGLESRLGAHRSYERMQTLQGLQ